MDDETTRQARRVCELFRGRFSEEVALKLVKELGGEREAVDFVLNEPEDQVRKFLKQTKEYLEHIRKESANVASLLENPFDTTVRQFACASCNRSWWRKVPRRKEVSKCRRCHVKYDPIPQEHEWNMCRFNCYCGNSFISPGINGVTKCKCFHCGKYVEVYEVLPPKNKRRDNGIHSPSPHSCNGINCHNRQGAAMQQPPVVCHGQRQWRPNLQNDNQEIVVNMAVCIHGKSRKCPPNRVLHASKKHISTGSTVATFLSQGSLKESTVDLNYNLEALQEEL